MKRGKYIKPVIDAARAIAYTVRADAGYEGESSDTITFTASAAQAVGQAVVGTGQVGGVTSVTNRKFPLRWNGEVCRITFTTDDGLGPDIINRFTLYANITGPR